jgi:uncharacterized membrane protein
MNIGLILKLLHILAGFGLMGGEIGRGFAFRRARQATDLRVTGEMMGLAAFLSSKVVSGSGLLTVILGLITAWAQGWPILGFLQGGTTNWVLASLVLYVILMVVVFTVQVPRGKAIGQALGAAQAQGSITPELTAALNDSTLKYGYIVVDTLLLLMIVLMVLKPF